MSNNFNIDKQKKGTNTTTRSRLGHTENTSKSFHSVALTPVGSKKNNDLSVIQNSEGGF